MYLHIYIYIYVCMCLYLHGSIDYRVLSLPIFCVAALTLVDEQVSLMVVTPLGRGFTVRFLMCNT